MFDRLFSHGTLHTAAHLGFFSGTGMLLPVLGKAWQLHIKPWLYSPYGFYVALGLILVSLIIIAFLAGSASKLLRSVGWLVLVPGVIALIFTAFGQANVFDWAEQHVTGFVAFEPIANFFVVHSVPTTAVLGGLYVLIGICCLWVGGKLHKAASFI
ncbi:MAG TPA: hypothetical protein VLJ21_05445 [Candidatus Binatia bacterium]|nr:hypothetical protein [Candidatus Binatia bacterium]